MLASEGGIAHAPPHREAQAVGLARAVVRILAEDQRPACRRTGVRCERGEHLGCGGYTVWRRARRRRTPGGRASRAVSNSPRRIGFQSVVAIAVLPSMRPVFGHLDPVRAPLATLPTPLERGRSAAGRAPAVGEARRPDRARGWAATRLASSSSCAATAIAAGARSLVTVGAAQSNHCRMTAAAGAVLGIEVHLVLSGDRPERAGGQPTAVGAVRRPAALHRCPRESLGRAEIAREALTDALAADGAAPYTIPIGGSTADRCARLRVGVRRADGPMRRTVGFEPAAIVHTSSSGGTHAGLVAGRALWRSLRASRCPSVLAIGVAKGVNVGHARHRRARPARRSSCSAGRTRASTVATSSSTPGWIGDDYAVPTTAGDEAMRWAAGTAAGCSTVRTPARAWPGCSATPPPADGRPAPTSMFIHTGGVPAVFAPGGAPDPHRPSQRHRSVCFIRHRRCVRSRQVGEG